MARHRAARRGTTVVVTGLVCAATGLTLLLSPAAPIAASEGSVLGGPGPGRPGTVPSSAPASPSPTPTSSPVPAAGTEPASAPATVPSAVPLTSAPPALAVTLGFAPDRLVVQALDVDAPLVMTLVDIEGAFVPPEDPAELGWWRGVRPGSGSGSVLVAGHIDSTRYGQGPLARLVDLRPGDRAVLTGPGGTRAEYVFRGIQTFPKESFPAAELLGAGGPERLVLVTCGGTFDRRQGSWDSNIVAVLDPVPPA